MIITIELVLVYITKLGRKVNLFEKKGLGVCVPGNRHDNTYA